MHATSSTPRRPLTRLARVTLLLMAGLLAGMGFAEGAIFVRIPGLKGDVTAEGYNDGNWFEAFSGTYGVERELVESCTDGTASLNLGVGRLLPIGMACHLNRAVAPLAQAAVTGNSVGEVEIHLVDLAGPAPVTFSIIRLEQAFVKDFTMETADTGRPWFQAFFIYKNLEIINRLSGPDGIVEQTVDWNLVADTDSPVVECEAMQAWLDQYFSAAQQEDPETSGLFLDIDKDGLPAALEYKLGLDPWNSSDGVGAVEHWMAEVGGQQYLQVSFVQRTDEATPLVRLEVEVGQDLVNWSADEAEVGLVSRTPLEGDFERLTYRLVHSRAERPKQFVRLSVLYSGEMP